MARYDGKPERRTYYTADEAAKRIVDKFTTYPYSGIFIKKTGWLTSEMRRYDRSLLTKIVKSMLSVSDTWYIESAYDPETGRQCQGWIPNE